MHLVNQAPVQFCRQGAIFGLQAPITLSPGFPYLGGLDSCLAAPRLATPRIHVPAGSVGIAGPQTGIYSVDSPGGWRLIGWIPLRLFDPQQDPPALLSPGDVVCFQQRDD